MGRPKGLPKTGGRQKGSPNKSTLAVKAALVAAFEEMGGIPSLVAWGKKNRTEFYKIWSRLIPTEIKNVDGERFQVEIVEELVSARANEEEAEDDPPLLLPAAVLP